MMALNIPANSKLVKVLIFLVILSLVFMAYRQQSFSNHPISMLANDKISKYPILAKISSVLENDYIKKLTWNIGGKTEQDRNSNDKEDWKIILFWTSWFGRNWAGRFKYISSEELKMMGCPSWRCNFTTDKNLLLSADAIVFSSTMVSNNSIPKSRTLGQRWVWVNVEAPPASPAKSANSKVRRGPLRYYFNWTMTYHSNSDVSAFYGHFLANGYNTLPLRPNLMSEYPDVMREYMESYRKNTTLEETMGPTWKEFVTRPKLVAWMSGHCGTHSKRESYVEELGKYVPLDKYGRCGKERCLPKENYGCWEIVLGPQYLFYLSFENSICDQYITEKLYLPLRYNMVPVVWGGSDYSKFLPPGSYINGRDYHPRDLATLLLRLQNDPVAYGRYHVWRKYWTAVVGGSLCELCHKLHTDREVKNYENIPGWRKKNNQCMKYLPKGLFTNLEKNYWRKVINPQHSDNTSVSLV